MGNGFIGLEGLAVKRTLGGREGLSSDPSPDPLNPIDSDTGPVQVDTDWNILASGDWANNGDWAFGFA